MLTQRHSQISTGDNGPSIHVPNLQLQATNGATTELTWWTSDESIKASVAETIQRAITTADQPLIARAHFPQALFGQSSINDRLRLHPFHKSHTIEQFQRLLEKLSDNYTEDEPIQHALSFESLGVLASTSPELGDGLLVDLSQQPETLSPEFKAHLESIRKLDTSKSEAQPLQIIGIESDSISTPGALAFPQAPILSNCLLAFTIRSHSPIADNPNFRLRMRFFCELWNPYSQAFSLKSLSAAPLHFELHITGLPNITVHRVDKAQQSQPIALQSLLGDPTLPESPLVIQLSTTEIEHWRAGQSQNWTGVETTENSTHSPYRSTETNSKQWNQSQHTLGGSAGIDTGEPRFPGKLRHTSPNTHQLGFRLYLINADTRQRTLLCTLEGLQYQAVSTAPTGVSNTHSGATFGYHFQLRGPHHSNNDPIYHRGRWLHDHDPRNPKPNFPTLWHLDNVPEINSGSAYVPVQNGLQPLPLPYPAAINETTATIETAIFRRLLDRSEGLLNYADELWQDAPLFEVPFKEPRNLASLQHLYFHQERPFKVGNSWGNQGHINTSQWFDQYFFSGRSNSTDSAFDHFKSLAHPLLPTTQTQPSAATLLVRNRFNINSTSIPAWIAVLSSLQLDQWAYTAQANPKDPRHTTRGASIAHFTHTQNEHYEASESPEFVPSTAGPEPVAPSAFYRRGIRHLTDEQVRKLATEIVHQLKKRQRPFLSMEDFLSPLDNQNHSLLEAAIHDALTRDGIQYWNPDWQNNSQQQQGMEIPIDHFAPGFITQADILATLGPMLSPRSDTFCIHAQARHHNPHNGQAHQTNLIAHVQRIPTPQNPDQPRRRRFVIRDLQWIAH